MGQKHNKKLWSKQEDQILKQAVEIINNDKWNDISQKYQQLYQQKYKIQSKRSGKQCRQRWYNKLHPALQFNLQEWTQQEYKQLIDGYKQLGPKWAKIIIRLCEAGYIRRGDNAVKNHFHQLVKKAVKQLNVFVEQYNEKGKQKGLFYQKPKKKYYYQKTYSIQRMVKMNKNGGIMQPEIQVQNDKKLKQQLLRSQQNQNDKHQLKYVEKQQQKTTQKLQEINQQLLIIQNKQNKLQTIQLTESIISQYHRTTNIENKMSFQNKENNENQQINQSKQNHYLLPLKTIDKNSIDRLLLLINNQHKQAKLQIISTHSVDQQNLRHVRNSFLDYIKNSELFNTNQTKQLIQQITDYSKCCKKRGKKAIVKRIKKQQGLSKFQIQKTSKQLYDKIIERFPQRKKIFNKNKVYIQPRLHFLAEKVYLKQQSLQQQINRQYFLRREEEQKIIKIIIQEAQIISKKQNQQNKIKRHKKIQKKGQMQSKNNFFVQLNKVNNSNMQQINKIQKTKRIKRIYKRRSQPTNNMNDNISKQSFKSNFNLNSQYIPNIKISQQKQKMYFENKNGIFSDINKEQINFNSRLATQKYLNIDNIKGDKKTNRKHLSSNFDNTIQVIQGKIQKKDIQLQVNYLASNVIMRKGVDSFQKQNKDQDNNFLRKYPSSQLVFKIPLKKPFQDRHIQSQNSQYSLKSKKSLRPNRILSKEETNLLLKQQPSIKGIFNNSQKQGGSFKEIKKEFPDMLVKSIQFGKESQLNKSSNYFNQQDIGSPINSNKSNFVFYNLQNKNLFNTNIGNVDPFKLLSNSQDFGNFNNSVFNKGSSTNYNTIQKPKSIYKSCDFLAMSCQNFAQPKNSQQDPRFSFKQQQNNFFNNSFLQNIRNIQENQNHDWKQTKVYNFDAVPQKLIKQIVETPVSNSNNGFQLFNPFNSQPIDFQIPQKLIETAKNPNFPIRNYNDYSLNYQHINSMQFSKVFEFDKRFGLNSARLSQIDGFKSQDKNQQNRSRSKQYDSGSNMFKSQRIQSLHGSCQFLNKNRQLSNSCIYSNHEQKSNLGSKNQQNKRIFPPNILGKNTFGSMSGEDKSRQIDFQK